MIKKIVLFVLLVFTTGVTHAQTADAIYDQYLEFNLARFNNESAKALIMGESLLPNVGKLPAKDKTIFNYSMAKLYEDSSQPDSAIVYYEKTILAEPNYYVPHRALGYLYLTPVNELYKKLQAAKDDASRSQLTAAYKNAVHKALPHLEKAQACDPSDETLAMIKLLYTNIKDTEGLNSLSARLAALSKNCVTVLSE